MTHRNSLRTLERADLTEATEVLVQAFRTDPAYRSLFEPKQLDAALAFLMSRLLAMRLEAGASGWAIDDDDGVVGLVCWARSNVRFGMGIYFRHGLMKMPFLFGLAAVRRMLSVDDEAGDLRKELQPPGVYAWISQIGVRPDRQGRGVGGQLLRACIDEAEGQGLQVVLMTTEPDNLAFYRHFGFDVLGERAMSTGFTAWMLSRPPPQEKA